jgi:AraC-like DNA-binding protein
MIITSNVNHLFEAGPEGTTLMQLEFLPDIFSLFNLNVGLEANDLAHTSVFLFSEENRLIKIVNNICIVRTVQRIINELEVKSPHYQYLAVMYYAELLILIYRHMNEAYLPICTNDSLRKAIAYIRLNYYSNINVKDVAEHIGISERHLRRMFSQHLNLAPLDYLNQTRVNKAIELLRNTDMSIKEVCFQCGFQSPQYFSRVFKQQTSISPREMTK